MTFTQICGALILLAATFFGLTWTTGRTPIEAMDCPPYWKCNGSAATNDANCKCWDSK